MQSEFLNKTSVVGHLLNANLQALENYLNLTFSTFYVSVLISWFKQSKDFKFDEYQATSFNEKQQNYSDLFGIELQQFCRFDKASIIQCSKWPGVNDLIQFEKS